MPKTIIWSPLAEVDLEKILNYLEINWGGSSSIKFIDMIEHSLGQISINPRQYPLINKRLRVRKCVLSNQNSLFYKNTGTHIFLLRIYDNRQDPKSLKFE